MNRIAKICADIRRLDHEDFEEVRVKLMLQKLSNKYDNGTTLAKKGLARNMRIFKKFKELYDEVNGS